MLLLSEGQMGKAWETSKKKISLENRGPLDRRVLSLSLERVSGVKEISVWAQLLTLQFARTGQDSDQSQNRMLWSEGAVDYVQHIVLH
jgi:hypothetical protein